MSNKKNGCNGCCNEEKKFDGFVDSIEEEIRNENWQKLWNKYGKLITYVSCALIISVGIYGMWQKQDLADREAISSRYTYVQSAIIAGDLKTAIPQIKELSNVSKKDYAILAKLEHAAILRSQNDAAALKEYESIYTDKKANDLIRELAYIFYVSSAIDLMPAKEISTQITVFIKELNEKYVGKTWDLFAKETLAFCYIKAGDIEMAKKTLEDLAKTTGIPETMAERAKILLHSLGE